MPLRKSFIGSGLMCLACFGLSLGGRNSSTFGQLEKPFQVLVFTKTIEFHHESIPAAVNALQELGKSNGFEVVTSDTADRFTDDGLRPFRCVVFCLTSGDVLDEGQQAAFERYIRGGGGYVGIHSASDTGHTWPWYGQLVGAYFRSHPSVRSATVKLNDSVHPSTKGLPKRWSRTDEWYSFQMNPRGRVHVLATLDERTYAPIDEMGFDHPIAWCQEFEGGRAWYTGGGHTVASYSEPAFLQHLAGGLLWAAGAVPGDARPTIDANYQKVVLDASPVNPMQLAVAPDGRVFYVERAGVMKVWLPDTRRPVVAATLAVDAGREDGLLGVTLDPGFGTNHWIYLFYSPAGTNPVQRVSRFTEETNQLDLATEKILLTIPVQRETCCHSAGGLEFGRDGDLFIGVGDNTNPFDSAGFAPLDERPERTAWDAQRSAGNANDLRGKILRIRPKPDGTYEIPPGNLFAPGTPLTRPEIFTMGNRNPFRFSIDSQTGWLYWGEVGPDAHLDDPTRGPRGYDEWNQARSAGNYGWPYFIADNQPYRAFDFASLTSGPPFHPESPVNNSPNNTGRIGLPPARPAWIWYAYADTAVFPELNGGRGRAAMAGPIYHFLARETDNHRRLPEYYDQTLFLFEWTRNYVKEVKLDDSGELLKINPFLPTFTFRHPIDMKIGPDGAIYLIEWGTNAEGNNADAAVVRIDYVGQSRIQSIQLQSTGQTRLGLSGAKGLTYTLDASTNLISWAPVGFTVATNGLLELIDPGGNGLARRFYRVRSLGDASSD